MPARRQTMEEWGRQQRAWRSMPKLGPVVRRGYEKPAPIDIEALRREAEKARELMQGN